MREIGNIQVIGYLDIGRVLEFNMEHRFNEHGKAYIRAQLKDEGVIHQARENNQVSICVDSEKGREILFVGNVEQISINRKGSNYGEVEVRLVSNSILLDKKKECRSYQNAKLTYEQLVDKAMDIDGSYIWNLPVNPTIDRPLIQYYETKWEFIKRVASHLNTQILSDITHNATNIHIGVPDCGRRNEINVISSRTELSKEFFNFPGRSQREFLYYKIESEDNLEVGSEIMLFNQKMTIFAKRAYTSAGRIVFGYDAGGGAHTEIQTYYNRDFIGRVIKGEVLSAKNETLRIKMEIDDIQSEEEAYDYEWCPESGNLMYCMPQVGTITSLYFGDWDERTGKIINCIRTNGDSCEDMSDPNNKMLTTEHDKRLVMNADSIKLIEDKNDEASSNLSLLDDFGVKIHSSKNIGMYAKGYISINGKNVITASPTRISCLQGESFDGNSKATLEVEVNVNVTANDVNYDFKLIYSYPNIMDAPEECDMGDLWKNIALGVLAAVGAALVVAALVAGGAFLLAGAGIATAAIGAAGGAGGIFVTAAISGSLAGVTAVAAKGIEDNMNNNVSDTKEYAKIGSVNAAVTALLAGVLKPVGCVIKGDTGITLSPRHKKMAENGKNLFDWNASYTAQYCFLEEDKSVGGFIEGLILNNLTSAGTDKIIGMIPKKEEISEALANKISRFITNETDAYNTIRNLEQYAFGKQRTPDGLRNLLEYMENNPSHLNGAINPKNFKLLEYIGADIGDTENVDFLWTEPKNIVNTFLGNVAEELVSKLKGEEEERLQKEKEHEESIKERGATQPDYYVVRGAELRCTCGSHMRRLDINEDDGYRIATSSYQKPYIGASQCKAGETDNIKNFGICNGCRRGETITLIKDSSVKGGGKKNRVTGVGCVPEILGHAWFDTAENAELKNAGVLVTGKSFLPCKYGGFIEIHTSGEEYIGDLDDGKTVAERTVPI